MKTGILITFLALASMGVSAQNLIGLKGKEIKVYMKENRKDLNYNSVKNSSFSYLKYSDGQESQTVLFFLDKDSVCNRIRIVCDQMVKLQKVKEYDSLFQKKGPNVWLETKKGKKFRIEIKDEEWTSVINIVPE